MLSTNGHTVVSETTGEQVFQSPSTGTVSVDEMVSQIAEFVKEEPDSFYRLVIGTDSQLKGVNGNSECDFVTAIIIHRTGHGARYFWKKEKVSRNLVLRDKIYMETMRSLDTAHNLVPGLRRAVSAAKYDLEIHIDVGSLGPTRDMLKEVVGMVAGNGFTPRTKPNSWGASSVADKYT